MKFMQIFTFHLQGDWESHFSGETTLHYRQIPTGFEDEKLNVFPHRPDNGEPLPTRLETQNRAHFTTFGHAPLPIQVVLGILYFPEP